MLLSSKLHFSVLLILEVSTLERHYGHLARILHWCTDQAITRALEEMDLTSAQGHIMGFLAHRKSPPCPKDIEEAFHLSHPTVSGLLSRMEKKGFVELRPDENDRRCKRIYVLPKGIECQQQIHQSILKIEQQLVSGFTPEEKQLFGDLLDRAIANMGCCSHPNHKEESQT